MQAVKPESKTRGRYHLAIYFVNHRQPQGKPYYFRSNKGQDRAGRSIHRLKSLVTERWDNQVSWAGLYEDQRQIAEFRFETNHWRSL